MSIVNYGFRSFHNVQLDPKLQSYRVYTTEKYHVNYKNLTTSSGINPRININLLNNPKCKLELGLGFYIEKFREELTLTLTDIGNGEKHNWTPTILVLANQQNIVLNNQFGYGQTVDLTLSRPFRNNLMVGVGLNYTRRSRSDISNRSFGLNQEALPYIPRLDDFAAAGSTYSTKQLGLSLNASKQIKRFELYVNMSQTVVTLKKEIGKGPGYHPYPNGIIPISHNSDYRFPMIVRVGANVGFDQIKGKVIICYEPF